MTETSSSPEGIEGLERLNTPQSSFTLNRRPRPPPIDLSVQRENSRPPMSQVPLHRQQSKGGIRGIFNRGKAEKPAMSPTWEVREPPTAGAKPINFEAAGNKTNSTSLDALKSPSTPGKPSFKTSRMTLRGRSVKETPAKASSKPVTKSSPGRASAVWDPPPLFQAYPQAIKHAQLSASTLSADAILRISNHRRNKSLTEYNPTATDEEKAAKKAEKTKNKHKRQLSGSLSKGEWTQKIFVLVTSGYLLQYSGEGHGSFDRLPEKMMQLGKDSVAFVSDVIPGKHWVLQVSQSMDADGTPIADSRSLLSRLTFRGGADYRRTATSLLLVFESAEEMDSWLAILRREIESLGGKKHVPDIARQKSEEQVHQLAKQPSHRYLVAKNPDQFSAPISPSTLGIVPAASWSRSNSLKQDDLLPVYEQPSTSHPIRQQSATNSVISNDGQHLDELRESNRFSYMSSGQRTSTQHSSPEPSPTRETMGLMARESLNKSSSEEGNTITRPNAAAINERRRSMQTMPVAPPDGRQSGKTQRHSTYGPNAVTPNFSVPNSSSRRFSSVKSHPLASVDPPAMTTLQTSSSFLQGSRKTPPPAIATARPLSPVNDASPSKRTDRPGSPGTPLSQNSWKQITNSVVDIAPRSPLPEHSPVGTSFSVASFSHRRENATPMREPGTAHLNFEFPKRPTNVHHDDFDNTDRTTATLPNKRHSVATPERHDHATRQILTPKQEQFVSPTTNTSQPLVQSSTNTKLRPMSFTPSSSSPANPSLTSYPFPRVSSNSSRTPPSSTRSHHQTGISDLPDLPTKLDLRSKGSSLQRLRASDDNSRKALANRRSMPFLVGGPPPAPPPDCALPALPPMGVMAKRLSVKA